MDVDQPGTLAEVQAQFGTYEQALMANDVDALNSFFWADPRAVRFGAAENLYGYQEIAAFRARRPVGGLEREVVRQVVTAHGADFATTSLEFRRLSNNRQGRQSQVWVRTEEGWRIVVAHVSLLGPGPT
jgi:ketosteroid isomerase-like protein